MTDLIIDNERFQIWEDYTPEQLEEIRGLLTDVITVAEEEAGEAYIDGYLDGRFATGVVLELEPREVEAAFDEWMFIPEGAEN